MSRECTSRGWVFEGFCKWGGNTTKLKLFNPYTGNRWETTPISYFITGSGDPSLKNFNIGVKNSTPDDIMVQSFMDTGAFLQGTLFNRTKKKNKYGWNAYWEYVCPVCSIDEYVKNGVCSGKFSSAGSNLSFGKLTCRCSNSFRWTEAQVIYKINCALNEENSTKFLGWVDGYSGRLSKFRWECSEGHQCETRVKIFLSHGSRCASCTAGGFSPNKPAYLYVTRWIGEGKSFIKYGITNRSYAVRVKEQQVKSSLLAETLVVYYSEDGYLVSSTEKNIKSSLPKGRCPKELLPDGYTETVVYTENNLKEILDICNKSGMIITNLN